MLNCPHCGGLLSLDYDGYEQYLVCMMCGREYDANGETRRFTPKEYFNKFGIKLNPMKGRKG